MLKPSEEHPDMGRSTSPRACALLCRPTAGSALSPGHLRIVRRSAPGDSSYFRSIGPPCIRLVRVGPSRIA